MSISPGFPRCRTNFTDFSGYLRNRVLPRRIVRSRGRCGESHRNFCSVKAIFRPGASREPRVVDSHQVATYGGVVMKHLVVVTLLLLTAALSTGRPARAASAVALADDMAYGYSYGHRTARDAVNAALRSCQRRTAYRCRVIVACPRGGHGAIAFHRRRGHRHTAAGASCGATDKQSAFREAVTQCNRAAGGRRCGSPRTAWFDRM